MTGLRASESEGRFPDSRENMLFSPGKRRFNVENSWYFSNIGLFGRACRQRNLAS